MSYAVNDGPVDTLTPENSVLLLIDHQVGLAEWIRDQSPVEFKNAVLGLAGTAKTLGIPTILTTSRDFGPNGQILPELRELFPDVPVIRRTGTINAYRWPEFRAALEATGRKKVIIAGVSSTTCLQFPALDMVADGYEVYGAIDASGSESQIARQAAIATLSTRGVQIRTWFSLAAELVADWRRDEANGWTLASGPIREHEVAWGHLLDISMDYATGRMTPPEGFVEGDESATPSRTPPWPCPEPCNLFLPEITIDDGPTPTPPGAYMATSRLRSSPPSAARARGSRPNHPRQTGPPGRTPQAHAQPPRCRAAWPGRPPRPSCA